MAGPGFSGRPGREAVIDAVTRRFAIDFTLPNPYILRIVNLGATRDVRWQDASPARAEGQ
ncbi:hypothetical protein GCM10028792_39420 [Salinisphaera aquimarina]